jgi:hypothetical protein
MKTLHISIGLTSLYSLLLIITLILYSKKLLNYDVDTEEHTNNGKYIFAVLVSSLSSMFVSLIIQIDRLCKKKNLLDPILESGYERHLWHFTVINIFITYLIAFMTFLFNCQSVQHYKCHYFTTPAYIFVLIPVYSIFLYIFFLIVSGIGYCCGYKIDCHTYVRIPQNNLSI